MPEVAFSPDAPLTAGSLLELQRRAGNRAASALVARQATSGRRLLRSGGLLKPQRVAEIYGSWRLEIARARGIDPGDIKADATIEPSAREKTKAQVGDLNFKRWEDWERGVTDAAWEAAKAKEAEEKAKEAPPLDMEGALRARHDQMWRETAAMRSEMVQTEYLAQKLDFGGGVKGGVARVTAGSYSAMYAVGSRSASSVMEHVPMMVLSGVGVVFSEDREGAYELGKKHAKGVAHDAESVAGDVDTTTQLVSGQLQEAYAKTRAPYNAYMAAFTAFSDASTQYLRDQELDGIDGYAARAKDIGAMADAEKKMRDANADYQVGCLKLGIQTKAKALDTLGKNIVKGQEQAVENAVMMVLPEVAPSAGEIWSALKGAEGMGAKQLERETADAVAKTLAKEEGAAMKIGADAELATGMPVTNQQAIADTCRSHDVMIEVRGTNKEAAAKLADGAMPKPEAIKAKTINDLDVYLGFKKEDRGLVGYMEPKAPNKSEVPPDLWEAVQSRYKQRADEFKDLAPEMKNLAAKPGERDTFAAVGFNQQVTVENGVVKVVNADGTVGKGFTGDHDLWNIRNADGSPVSPEKYNEIVAELVNKRVGVEHGAHTHWDVPLSPNDPHFKDPAKGFQAIADKHLPGAKDGEDLFRFAPDGSVTPIRAHADLPQLTGANQGDRLIDAARRAGRADKGAAVGNVDATVGGIGPH